MSDLTHVIVLAQGEQSRLPNLLGYPKQALRLPACGYVPIITRTLRQVAMISGIRPTRITVVATPVLQGCIDLRPELTGVDPNIVDYIQLAAPGNSSLKGIARYLEGTAYGTDQERDPQRVIVLLGDVVYSWRCLQELIGPAGEGHRNHYFVGSSDLSPAAGELWGLGWERSSAPAMLTGLSEALGHHPPFEDYQPGQLRRWLWEMGRGHASSPYAMTPPGMYITVDDYTRDIDVPEHVEMIAKISESAREEDLEYGVHWPAQW